MGKLKILSDADSSQKQNQQRGKLFEDLMSKVLRNYGYQIDSISNVNYAGNEIDCPKMQAFYGKYMSKWRKDSKATGIFIAIPGLNSHAKGFYNESTVS